MAQETKSSTDSLPNLNLKSESKDEEKKPEKKEIMKKERKISKMKKSINKIKKAKPMKSDRKPEKENKSSMKKRRKRLKSMTRDLVTEKDIAMDFAAKVHKKFTSMIKSTVLFGSQAKNTNVSGSDIDIIIIIDDAAIEWDLELVSWYREELSKLMAVQEYENELHINTIKLTTWWNDLMHGDPVVINILRYGEALIDTGGFFNPIKALLLKGKIHATPEAVYTALQRAPTHLARSKFSALSAIEGIYWAFVDSAQAALITLGKLPPSPEHITGMLNQHFVGNKMLKSEYMKWYREIYSLHKGISHGQVKHIKGVDLDDWQERAEKFMLEMSSIIDKLVEASRKED